MNKNPHKKDFWQYYFRIPLFLDNVYFYIFDDLEVARKRRGCINPKLRESFNPDLQFWGRVIKSINENGQDDGIYGVFFQKKSLCHSAISHEIHHLGFMILDRHKIYLSDYTLEIFAYLDEYLTNEFYKFAEKNKLKIHNQTQFAK